MATSIGTAGNPPPRHSAIGGDNATPRADTRPNPTTDQGSSDEHVDLLASDANDSLPSEGKPLTAEGLLEEPSEDDGASKG